MVNQGDIIKIDFNPQLGHETAGYRPALVVSTDVYNQRTRMAMVCPITNTDNQFPLHVSLDSRTKTTGVVMCEHLRSVDLAKRNYRIIEKAPVDLLERAVDIIYAEMEIIKPSQTLNNSVSASIIEENDEILDLTEQDRGKHI